MALRPPTLHTVYAGYGDALLLEFSTLNTDLTERRHLVIIDGGPGVGIPAQHLYPYPKYFVTAVRRVWKAMRDTYPGLPQRPTPTAIINSHPDHDHTHGLLALLYSAADTGDMDFAGPLMSPIYWKNGAEPPDHMHKAVVFRNVVRAIYPAWHMRWMNDPLSTMVPGLNMVQPQVDANSANVVVYSSDTTTGIPIQTAGPMIPGHKDPGQPKLPDPTEWLQVSWSNTKIVNVKREFNVPTPGIDKSEANLGSILLETDEKTTGGRVSLTGDSGADQIVAGWGMQNQNARQKFSIYKLSHHGSIKNNMFGDNGFQTYVKSNLLYETALRELLEIAVGKFLITNVDKAIEGFSTGVFSPRWAELWHDLSDVGPPWAVAQAILQIVFPDADHMKHYLEILRYRHKWHLIRVINPQHFIDAGGDEELADLEEMYEGVISIALDPTKPNSGTTGNPVHLLAYIRNLLNSWYVAGFPDGVDEKSTLRFWMTYFTFKEKVNNVEHDKVRCRVWWGWFYDPDAGIKLWGSVYATLEQVAFARNFYGMFDADAYVVSANGHHGHPNEATIAGLALALLLDTPNPTRKYLFLTNGWSLEPLNLLRILQCYKPADATLFWSGLEMLEIRYLAKGTYFSLNGATVPANALRETTGRTRLFDTTSNTEQNRIQEVHKFLEHDRAVLPARAAVGTNYHIRLMNGLINGQAAFLTLNMDKFFGVNAVLRPMDNNLHAVGVLDVFETVPDFDASPKFLNGNNGVFLQIQAHNKSSLHCDVWADTHTSDGGFLLQWKKVGEFLGIFAVVEFNNGQWAYNEHTEIREMKKMLAGSTELVRPLFPVAGSKYLEPAWFKFEPVVPLIQQQAQGQMRMLATLPEAIVSPEPPQRTIGEYLTAIAYRTNPASFTVHDILLVLLGYDRLHNIEFIQDLNYTTAFHVPVASPSVFPVESYILSAPIDNAASWVRFTTSAHRVDVLEGHVVAKVASFQRPVQHEGQARLMAEAYFHFKFTADGRLEYSFYARPQQFNVPVYEATDAVDAEHVPADKKTSSLASFLDYVTKQAGIVSPELDSLTLPRLLAFLCNETVDTAWQNARNPFFDTFLGTGLLGFKPDAERSRVHVEWSPTGQFRVRKAEIVLSLDPARPYFVDLADAGGVLQRPVLHITDAGMSRQHIAISCAVQIGAKTISVTSADGRAYAATMADRAPTLTLTVQGGTDLASVAALWPNRSTGPPPAQPLPFADRPLASLTQTGAGVVLAKMGHGDVSYTVRNLFAAVSLADADWRAWLPESMAWMPESVRGSVRVEMRDPFEADTRAIGVVVEFVIPLRDGAVEVPVSLSALPLGDGAYDYRLAIQSPGRGVSVAELLNALGLASRWEGLKTAYPTLTNISEGVDIKTLAVSLTKSGANQQRRLAIGGYVVELSIPQFTILSGIVELYDVTLTAIDDNGVRDIRGSGKMRVGADSMYIVAVDFALPTTTTPGLLDVSLYQGGPSAGKFVSHTGLPDLSGLPLLGSITKDGVALSRVAIAVGYATSTAPSPSVLSASFEINTDRLTFSDNWDFENISASIEHYTALATGGKAATSYSISAVTTDGTFAARIGYDNFNSRLEVSFMPKKVVKLVDAVKRFIGEGVVTNVLSGIVNDMGVKAAHMSYNASTKAVEVAVLELVDAATLPVVYTDADKAGKTQGLTGLRLQYTAATSTVPAQFYLRAKTSGTNASALFFVGLQWDNPTTKTLAVSLQPEDGKKLTLTGALSLFGQRPTSIGTAAPDGLNMSSNEWWDLDVMLAEGSLKLTTDPATQKSVITLSSLHVQVELTQSLTIWNNISLKKLQIHVRYTEAAGLHPDISAEVSVGSPAVATLSLACKKDAAGTEVWTGKGALLQTLSPQEFGEKVAGVSRTGVYKLPTDQNLPADIPLANLDVTLTRGRSLLVTATVGVGHPAWLPSLLGVNITATNLGMQFLVRSKTSVPAPPATVGVTVYKYEAWLVADIKLSGFKSAKAQFAIPLDGEFVLTAQLLKEPPPSPTTKTIAFADVSTQIASAGKTAKVTDLVPITQITTQLDPFGAATAISLYANFTTKHFLLAGGISPQAGLVFLAKQTKAAAGAVPAEYGYFVSFAAPDAQTIWADVAAAFNVSKVEANIVALEATVGSLGTDLQLAVQTLRIQEAARQEVGTLASGTTDDAQKTLALVQKKDTKLEKGSWFFATLDLTTTTAQEKRMMSTVKLGLSPSSPSTKVVVWGLVKSTTPSSYGLQLSDFRLLGDAIVITGAGTYKPPPTNAPDTFVSIDVEATAVISGITEPPLTLAVTWQQSKNLSHFELRGQKHNEVVTPFAGEMFNVRMSSWSVTGDITRDIAGAQTAVYKLSCMVALGTGTEYALNGAVLFVAGVPKIAEVTYGETVKIDQVFGDVIKPGSAAARDWPADRQPFALLSARLYYAQGPPGGVFDVGQLRYRSGYHIEAKLELLGRRFGVYVDLPSKNDRKGIVLTGAYEQKVDLGFMVLEGYTPVGGVKTKGMTALIDTTGAITVYKIESGLVLFGHPGFKVDLKYLAPDTTHSTWGLKGTAAYEGTSKVLGLKPTIGFTYRAGRFALDGWEMLIDDVQKFFDLKQAIEEASTPSPDGTSVCQKIVGLLFDSVVKTRVRISAELDVGDPGEGKPAPASVQLLGTVNFDVLVSDVPISTVQFKWPISVDSSAYNSEGLFAAIRNTILKNGEQIGKAFLKDPAKLAAVIGLLKVESWAKSTLAALICHGIDPPNVVTPVTIDDYNKKWKEVEEIVEKVKDVVDKVRKVLTIAELIAAAEELVVAIGIFGTALGVLFGLVNKLRDLLRSPEEKKKYQDEADAMKTKKEDAERELAALKDKLLKAMTLTGSPVATYSETDVLRLDWNDKMPNPPVFPSDPMTGIKWTIRYGPHPERDHSSNEQTQFSVQGKSFVWQHKDSRWIPKPRTYVWIMAHYPMKDGNISTPWMAAVPAIDSVLRVQVKVLDANAYTQSVVITLPKPAKTTYQVCMATNSPPGSPGTVVLSYPVTADNLPFIDFTVNWADIKPLAKPDPMICTLLRTYTRTLTPQNQANPTLGWSEATEKIQFYKGASGVAASFSSGKVTVDWRQLGSRTSKGDDFAIKLTRNGLPVPAVQSPGESMPAGSRRVVFSGVVDQAISMVAEITAHPPPGTDPSTVFCIPAPCPVVHTPFPTPTAFVANVNLTGNMLKNGDFSAATFSGWTVNPNNNPVEIRSPGAEGRQFGFWTDVVPKSSEPYACTQLTQWVDCELGKRYKFTIRWRFGSADNNSYLNCHLDHGDGIVSVRSGDDGAWRQQDGEFAATKTRHEIVVNMLGTWHRGMPWEIAYVRLEKLPEFVAPNLAGSLLKNGDFATGTTASWTVNNNNNPIEVRTPGFEGQRYKLWTDVLPKPGEAYVCTQLTQFVDCQIGAKYKMTIRWRFGSADNNSYLNCHLDHADGIISVRSGDNGALRTAEGEFTAKQARHEIVVNMLGTWYRGMPWEISWVKLEKTADAPPAPHLVGSLLKNGDFGTGTTAFWTVNNNNNPIEVRTPGFEGQRYKLWTDVRPKPGEAYVCTQLTQWVDCQVGARYRMTVRWRFGSSDNNSYLNCHLDHGDGIISVRSGDNGALRTAEGEFTARQARHEIVVNMLGTWYRGMPWEISWVKLVKV